MLSDDPRAVPVRRSGYIDHTKDKGPRMFWQFWFADGSSKGAHNPKVGLAYTRRMMKAGTIEPEFGDAERAKKRRTELLNTGLPKVGSFEN
jgi:hypothetical protein